MTAIVSLTPNPGRPGATDLIEGVAHRLALEPRPGGDGAWEFSFAGTYGQAHAAVVQALAAVDPAWPTDVTLEYALAI
jgi:hypothetical protein